MLELTGRVVVCVLLVPPAVLVAVRLPGIDVGFPLAALLTVYPWVLALAVVASAVAALVRWPLGLAAGAVVATVGAVVLLPRLLSGPAPATPPRGPQLVVAVANLRVGSADAAHVVGTVAERDVDVLVTLELTEASIDELHAAGLDRLLPNAVLEPSRLTSGGGIHSRLPMSLRAASQERGFGRTPRATIDVPGAGRLQVDAVHPLPPIDARWTARWRQTLAALGPPASPAQSPRLVAGDFNATHDHAPFRALLADGWVDAADAVGHGLVPTFSGLGWGEPVPPVTLDHVLVDRRTAVESVEVVPLPGSDHRMLVARLRLPVG